MVEVAPGGKSRRRPSDTGLDPAPIRALQPQGRHLRSLCSARDSMNTSSVQIKEPVPMSMNAYETVQLVPRPAVETDKLRRRSLVAVPLAAVIALAVHAAVSKAEPVADTRSYFWFLVLVLGVSLAAAIVQPFWPGLRRWWTRLGP